jgi:predicted AlkP superfamily pyrophosphatase or phosphodiesterase
MTRSHRPTRHLQALLFAAACVILASAAPRQESRVSRPRLVIVIVVDQLRPDYLTRFQPYFAPRGLNLFLRRGADFTAARYEHAITFTCPGHAVVLTGSYADANGIVANGWYDVVGNREENCAGDSSVSLIGVAGEGRSPRNLIDSTVGDVLKNATGGRGRVVTVAGKDRSAIMLGGHLADAAYWLEDTLIVTSTYYERELPGWVRRFNASGVASSYLGKTWNRLLPVETYAAVGDDDVAAEEDIAGTGRTFPHRPVRDASGKGFLEAFSSSPFHNEVLARFAMRAIIEENLGRDDAPDVLGIGFSANDLIGHESGPDSHEVMDVTVRTDRLLQQLFDFVDGRVGLKNVVVVLTADHGVAPLPEVMRKRDPGSAASRFDPSKVAAAAEAALVARYGPSPSSGWVVHHDFPFLCLNVRALEQRGAPLDQAEQVAKRAVEGVPGVYQVLTATELAEQRRRGAHSSAELSFYPGRSGHVFYQLKPYLVPGSGSQGTTHGSAWPYDTHVPLLWFGAEIVPGTYDTSATVADIAPTLSVLLGIGKPGGSRGRVLREMLR